MLYCKAFETLKTLKPNSFSMAIEETMSDNSGKKPAIIIIIIT